MADKDYIIFCGFCGHKEVVSTLENMIKIAGCTACDGEKVRCNKCGRPVSAIRS